MVVFFYFVELNVRILFWDAHFLGFKKEAECSEANT